MSRRHGILVGVDHYPHFPIKNQLSCCVRDAALMANVLEERFGFHRQALHLLRDDEATQEKIWIALAEVVERTRADDQVVFFFSGHGSWMTDETRPTRRAETLVPHDSGRRFFDPPSENRDLRDDELYRWLLELSAITPYITVIFDSCHAGSALREDPAGVRYKGVPGDPAPTDRSSVTFRGHAVGTVFPDTGFRDTGPSGWLPLSERYVLLAACRAEQAAMVHYLPDSSKQSAFTFFLARELLRLSGLTTYRDVGERLQPVVSAHFPNQFPQVEGARDRVLFGVETLAPRPYLPVRRQEGERVWLGGGAVHGVQPQSRWALLPPGTRCAEDCSPLGYLSLTTVQATEAEGQLAEDPKNPLLLPDGCRAFEVERRLALSLPVILEEDEDTPGEAHFALRQAINASGLLVLVDTEQLTGPAWTVRADWSAAVGGWKVLDVNGLCPLPPLQKPTAVVATLEAFARQRHVLSLEPLSVAPSLHDGLEVELLRRQPTTADAFGGWQIAKPEDGGPPVFHEGDELAIRTHNRLRVPIHLHVLDLGLTGAITLLHPVPGEFLALPGGRIQEIGLRPGEELEVGVPEEFIGIEGLEWLKIFATTQEADLSFLESGAPRQSTGQNGSPLERLVGAAWMADSLREEIFQEAVTDSWLAARVAFRVRRLLPETNPTCSFKGLRPQEVDHD